MESSQEPAVWVLDVMREDRAVHSHPMLGPTQVGRAPGCDLVLLDPSISSTHVLFQVDGSQVVVTDLSSTNGTFIGDERLIGPVAVDDGKTLRLGLGTTVRVRRIDSGNSWPSMRVELPEEGVSIPFLGSQVDVGELTLHRRGARAVWATRELEDVGPVAVDAPLAGSGMAMRVVTGPLVVADTHEQRILQVRGSLGGITLVEGGASHAVRAPNRVSLLYTLALAWRADAGKAVHERGWRPDDRVAVAVWGRERLSHLTNNYNVLLSRVRQGLRADGLDPHALERRPGQTRLRCGEVELE